MEKDIDKIYRRRFDGAKMSPPEDSWENILSQLPPKKEKRKLLPVWFKLAGVAAVVALFIAVYPQIYHPPVEEDKVVVASTADELNFNTSDVSSTFHKIMEESGILLQALILENQLQNKEQNIAEVKAGVKAEIKKEAPGRIEISSRTSPPVEQLQNTEIVNSKESIEEDSFEEIADSQGLLSPEVAVLEKNQSVAAADQPEESQKKFKLSTRVAPVYFNNFGNGNVVNNSFSQKEASGEVTFSYGVSVAYAVSKNVNIRSGVNKVNLEYNTREVSFNDVAGNASFGGKVMGATTLASPTNGNLNQKMGFVEVPLELEYVLVDKNFSLGIIGGGSVLFLEKNDLLLEIPGEEADLGDTNSMNKLSYTTNLGLGLGYNLSRQLQLSLEPVVKFQMNTFRNSDGQRPYFFGLYSGFSYKF